MAQTPPPAVDELPPEPNSSNPVPFSGLMDTFLAALAPFRSGMIALATNCYSNTVDCYNNADAAAASAAAAAASSNATKWVSGTNYGEGDVVWSPVDFLNYRRKSTGSGTVDPSSDAGNWICLDILIDTSVTSNEIRRGSKTFTVSTGKRFQGGMYLVIADTAAPSTNSMYGQVESYNSGTGDLVITVLSFSGSGTKSAWTISQSSAGAVDAVGNNLVINGACQIAQVNGTNIVISATGSYPIDYVRYEASVASKISHQQVSTSLNASDSSHALQSAVVASYAPSTSDYFINQWRIEGTNIAHLKWGTANAKAVSLQFEALASVAGTYSGSLINAANNRCYPFSFTLAASTTTLIKIENIPGDTSGTWLTTAAKALSITFDLGCGVNTKTTANAWAAGLYLGVTGATNLVSQANGSTLSITNVQLEVGSRCRLFERKLWVDELIECQRCHPVINGINLTPLGSGMVYSATEALVSIKFPVRTRVPITGMTATNNGILSCRQQGGSVVAGTGIVLNRVSVDGCVVDIVGMSGLSGSTDCEFNQTSSLIFTGAEL
jgi:hypothetical protein